MFSGTGVCGPSLVCGPGPATTKKLHPETAPPPPPVESYQNIGPWMESGGSVCRPELLFNDIMMIQGGIDPPQIMATLDQMEQ